jgi:membrane-associated phospholipid phosphatase
MVHRCGRAFSVLIGFSRMYLDVPLATDVLGGWSIGLGIASGCALGYEWRPSPRRDRASTTAME